MLIPSIAATSQNNGCTRTGICPIEKRRSYGLRGGSRRNILSLWFKARVSHDGWLTWSHNTTRLQSPVDTIRHAVLKPT